MLPIPIPPRHRSLTLLAGVLVVQVLLLASQIRGERDMRLVRTWAVTLVTPFQRAGTWMMDSLSGAWGNYVDLRKAREENARLSEELSELKLRATRLEGRAAEADRLSALLEFREAHKEAPMVVARVIGASAGATRTVFIDRGERDAIRKNLAVITPDGVVGKVIEAYATSAEILLLTDQESGIGALLESTRTQGVVRGPRRDSREALPLLDYVMNEEQVALGERILTSGQDRIFPKDLPIGTVAQSDSGNPFKKIRVRPAARLDRLEEVIVLLSRQELDLSKDEAAAASAGAPKPQP